MKARIAAALALAVGATLAVTLGASARKSAFAPIPAFSTSQLAAPGGNDWVAPLGNLGNQRHSSLRQITTDNVKDLEVAWHARLAIPGVKLRRGAFGALEESAAVTYQGTVFIPDGDYNVYAVDGTTGERLWYYKAKKPKGLAPF